MEDYQVRQTMFRVREPVLFIDPVNPDISLPLETDNILLFIELMLKNEGYVTANSVVVNVYLPSRLTPYTDKEWNPKPLEQKQVEGCTKCNLITVNRDPISLHPGQEVKISGSNVRSSIGIRIEDMATGWNENIQGYYEIYTENMTPKYGQITYEFANSNLKISTRKLPSLSYVPR